MKPASGACEYSRFPRRDISGAGLLRCLRCFRKDVPRCFAQGRTAASRSSRGPIAFPLVCTEVSGVPAWNNARCRCTADRPFCVRECIECAAGGRSSRARLMAPGRLRPFGGDRPASQGEGRSRTGAARAAGGRPPAGLRRRTGPVQRCACGPPTAFPAHDQRGECDLARGLAGPSVSAAIKFAAVVDIKSAAELRQRRRETSVATPLDRRDRSRRIKPDVPRSRGRSALVIHFARLVVPGSWRECHRVGRSDEGTTAVILSSGCARSFRARRVPTTLLRSTGLTQWSSKPAAAVRCRWLCRPQLSRRSSAAHGGADRCECERRPRSRPSLACRDPATRRRGDG
jgi:hypothetical protein